MNPQYGEYDYGDLLGGPGAASKLAAAPPLADRANAERQAAADAALLSMTATRAADGGAAGRSGQAAGARLLDAGRGDGPAAD